MKNQVINGNPEPKRRLNYSKTSTLNPIPNNIDPIEYEDITVPDYEKIDFLKSSIENIIVYIKSNTKIQQQDEQNNEQNNEINKSETNLPNLDQFYRYSKWLILKFTQMTQNQKDIPLVEKLIKQREDELIEKLKNLYKEFQLKNCFINELQSEKIELENQISIWKNKYDVENFSRVKIEDEVERSLQILIETCKKERVCDYQVFLSLNSNLMNEKSDYKSKFENLIKEMRDSFDQVSKEQVVFYEKLIEEEKSKLFSYQSNENENKKIIFQLENKIFGENQIKSNFENEIRMLNLKIEDLNSEITTIQDSLEQARITNIKIQKICDWQSKTILDYKIKDILTLKLIPSQKQELGSLLTHNMLQIDDLADTQAKLIDKYKSYDVILKKVLLTESNQSHLAIFLNEIKDQIKIDKFANELFEDDEEQELRFKIMKNLQIIRNDQDQINQTLFNFTKNKISDSEKDKKAKKYKNELERNIAENEEMKNQIELEIQQAVETTTKYERQLMNIEISNKKKNILNHFKSKQIKVNQELLDQQKVYQKLICDLQAQITQQRLSLQESIYTVEMRENELKSLELDDKNLQERVEKSQKIYQKQIEILQREISDNQNSFQTQYNEVIRVLNEKNESIHIYEQKLNQSLKELTESQQKYSREQKRYNLDISSLEKKLSLITKNNEFIEGQCIVLQDENNQTTISFENLKKRFNKIVDDLNRNQYQGQQQQQGKPFGIMGNSVDNNATRSIDFQSKTILNNEDKKQREFNISNEKRINLKPVVQNKGSMIESLKNIQMDSMVQSQTIQNKTQKLSMDLSLKQKSGFQMLQKMTDPLGQTDDTHRNKVKLEILKQQKKTSSYKTLTQVKSKDSLINKETINEKIKMNQSIKTESDAQNDIKPISIKETLQIIESNPQYIESNNQLQPLNGINKIKNAKPSFSLDKTNYNYLASQIIGSQCITPSMKDSISLKNGTKFDDLDEEWKRDKGEKMEDKKENQLMNNVFTKTGLNRQSKIPIGK